MINRRFSILAPVTVLILALSWTGCAKKIPPKETMVWLERFEPSVIQAAETQKPLMIEFMAAWCPSCRMMDDSTFVDPRVVEKSRLCVSVRIDVDKDSSLANRFQANARKYGGVGIPNIIFMTPDQKVVAHPIGYMPADRLLAVMDSVLTVWKP